MAKKRSARLAARKVKDKWRSKQWYTIRAPGVFNEAEIGETLADEPEKLEGRIAEATLQDVTGDFSKQHVKCNFKIRGVRGTDAVTTFDGHDLTSDYVRRLIRRGHSKIDDTVDTTTADGFTVRLKPMVVTERRVQASQGTAIRKIARDVIEKRSKQSYSGMVKELVQGNIAKEIYDECRLIMPLKRVEIRKSELLSEPQDAVELLDVFAPPEGEGEDEEVSEEPEDDEVAETGEDDASETDEEASDEEDLEGAEEADEEIPEEPAETEEVDADEAPEAEDAEEEASAEAASPEEPTEAEEDDEDEEK